MNEPILELLQVRFDYPGRQVLRDLDFQLHPGERVALTGPNGAGKTTMLHLAVGLHRVTSGRVWAFGRELCDEADFVPVRAKIGLLFQDSDDQLFCPTVLEDVAFGPLNLGRTPEQARADAEVALAVLGLDGLQDRVTHRLSAGVKRLVALATVLAMQPRALLLDEPTSGLDEAAEQRLIEHLSSLPQAMVIISHDRRVLDLLATRRVGLRDGRLFPRS